MLRSVVESFLDSVSEREFDSPLLALLAAQGFSDIHFTHGAFEFGKDVIAKRVDADSGQVRQYAIQAKAGDIGMGEWRSIRPQIEEAEENTLSHPNFDSGLPRVAVLATTGRIVGGAALDAQQVAQRAAARGASFVVWDRQQFAEWLAADPELGLSNDNSDLLRLIAAISQRTVREQDLEFYARNWLPSPSSGGNSGTRAAIEAAVIANRLRQSRRLDLAAYAALHLLRASWSASPSVSSSERPRLAASAISLFSDYVGQLLTQTLPKLNEPKALLWPVLDPTSIVTYPVVCCRLIELFALLAMIEEQEPDLVGSATGGVAAAAVVSLLKHPGSTRPVTDDFGASVIAPAILMDRFDKSSCDLFLHRVAKWILQRYDAQADGLGLGPNGEPEEQTAERLLGASLESTKMSRRRASYLATVLLDLAAMTERDELYDAFLENLTAYDIFPSIMATGASSVGARNGPNVAVRYRAWRDAEPRAPHHSIDPLLPALDELLVASSARSRHNYRATKELLATS